jgi:hypothetical protein
MASAEGGGGMSNRLCVNGDGRPICPPSKVICRECLTQIGANLRRLLAEATGERPHSEEGWSPAPVVDAEGGGHGE